MSAGSHTEPWGSLFFSSQTSSLHLPLSENKFETQITKRKKKILVSACELIRGVLVQKYNLVHIVRVLVEGQYGH